MAGLTGLLVFLDSKARMAGLPHRGEYLGAARRVVFWRPYSCVTCHKRVTSNGRALNMSQVDQSANFVQLDRPQPSRAIS